MWAIDIARRDPRVKIASAAAAGLEPEYGRSRAWNIASQALASSRTSAQLIGNLNRWMPQGLKLNNRATRSNLLSAPGAYEYFASGRATGISVDNVVQSMATFLKQNSAFLRRHGDTIMRDRGRIDMATISDWVKTRGCAPSQVGAVLKHLHQFGPLMAKRLRSTSKLTTDDVLGFVSAGSQRNRRQSLTADWEGERELHAVVKEETNPTAGNLLGMEFVKVPAGLFRMGSNDGDYNEKPVHDVWITRPFWIGKCEVMQAEYEELMGKNPSHSKGAGSPVECVSWNDAVAFCTKLTERERAAGRLLDEYAYRLPTEAEWEYAARGGTKSKGFMYSGSNCAEDVAWHDRNSGGKMHAVGQKKPNELGIHDMSGNVWEWCGDLYGAYPSGAVTDPIGARTGQDRVQRGGGWKKGARDCRAACRSWIVPWPSYRNLGFRVVLGPVR